MWVSGSYDHTVKIWDTRTRQATITHDHGFAVEDVLVLPSGGLIVSAGDNQIKVWDVLAGKLLHCFSNHQKAITSLALDSTGSRLLSASLDHHVKFYDISSFSVTHSMKYEQPVMCVGLSPDNRALAVGMADGTLSIKRMEVSWLATVRPPPPHRRTALHRTITSVLVVLSSTSVVPQLTTDPLFCALVTLDLSTERR